MSLQALVILLVVTTGIAAAASAVHVLARRHRQIWQELFRLREQLRALRADLISVQKEAVRAGVHETTRLPVLLPSQDGEEIVLWNFFDRKKDGFFIDVGAYDGITFSNTYFFEALGWTGILIEPMPDFFDACRTRRPYSRVIHAALSDGAGKTETTLHVATGAKAAGLETLSFIGDNPLQLARIERAAGRVHSVTVPCRSLNEILADHKGSIDFVSIDVEGAELDVLRGFDVVRYRPRVLVVEDNSYGVDKRVGLWLGERGYEERLRCEHNVFYTRADDSRAFTFAAPDR